MLDAYRRHLRAIGRSDGTIEQRIGDLYRFAPSVRHDLLSATPDDIERYFAARASAWAPETMRKVRASLRCFYDWALKSGYISVDPTLDFPPFRVPRALPRPVPERDVLAAFERGTLQERAIIALAGTLGLRRSEITKVHTNDITDDTLRVVGKNGHHRIVQLDSTTLALLNEIREEQGDGYIFPGRFGGHLHHSTVYKWLRRVSGYPTHTFRHRAASKGYAETRNLRAVQELLGHASIATTQIYTAVQPHEIREVTDATSLPLPASPHEKGTQQ